MPTLARPTPDLALMACAPNPRGGDRRARMSPARLAGLRTRRHAAVAALHGRRCPGEPSALDGFRSCSPLRDSPGFPPGSLSPGRREPPELDAFPTKDTSSAGSANQLHGQSTSAVGTGAARVTTWNPPRPASAPREPTRWSVASWEGCRAPVRDPIFGRAVVVLAPPLVARPAQIEQRADSRHPTGRHRLRHQPGDCAPAARERGRKARPPACGELRHAPGSRLRPPRRRCRPRFAGGQSRK